MSINLYFIIMSLRRYPYFLLLCVKHIFLASLSLILAVFCIFAVGM